jgi:hypothetical protein
MSETLTNKTITSPTFLDLAALETEIKHGMACECARKNHHPGRGKCDQEPTCATKVHHAVDCEGSIVVSLCTECLNEAIKWAKSHVGRRCYKCNRLVRNVSDLVGPVVEIR